MRTWLWRRFYLYLLDHGFLRLLYSNFYRLPGGLYRTNQPTPSQLRRYKKRYGIKTVFNLRGGNEDNPAWQLEREACDKLGIKMIDLRLLSRSFPYVEDIQAAREAITTAEYPALVHCKSGADRAGLFSVLYRVFRLGEPVEQASSELGLKYGHIRWARTGSLDQFLLEYLKDRKRENRQMRLEEWLVTLYDRDSLKRTRPERGLLERCSNFVVDRILKRE
jgi:protein tyrosine/serine phosphatase